MLEVETPVVGSAVAVEVHLDPIPCRVRPHPGATPLERFLLTSPEAAMKRLLAAGSGPIYQITRAFRDGERGRRHQPEFTILEWYRPGFDHHELMAELEALFRFLLPELVGPEPFPRRTYRALFEGSLGIDPHRTEGGALREVCTRLGIDPPGGLTDDDRDDWLDLILVTHLEPTLSDPVFIHEYPASQAALARIRPDDSGAPVGERFELYARGLELANGYHELIDAAEQRRRFEEANAMRRAAGRPALPIDEPLLEALEAGLPACSGVAVGLDRLAMLAARTDRIDDVVAFPIDP